MPSPVCSTGGASPRSSNSRSRVAAPGRDGRRGVPRPRRLQVRQRHARTRGRRRAISRVGGLLRGAVRETDTLARMGGDEFALLLTRCDRKVAVRVAEKLLEIAAPRRACRHRAPRRLSCSIGIALFGGDDGISADELVVEADIAMYEAKDEGKDRYAVYDLARRRRHRSGHPRELVHAAGAGHRVRRLRAARAADRGDLRRRHARVRAAAAPARRARRPHPAGDVPAQRRAPRPRRADRSLGARARGTPPAREPRAGLRPAAERQRLGADDGRPVARDARGALLAAHPIPPDRLVIEITETAAITSIQRARELAHELRELGCMLALDDFGAGFASFYYLKHLRFDYLKIDGEFIRNLCVDADRPARRQGDRHDRAGPRHAHRRGVRRRRRDRRAAARVRDRLRPGLPPRPSASARRDAAVPARGAACELVVAR